MTRTEACHVRSHTAELGNECANVMADLDRRGLRWSPYLLHRLPHCVHRRLTRKSKVQTIGLYSILY